MPGPPLLTKRSHRCGFTLSGSTSTTCVWPPTSRPSHLHDRGRRSKTRRGRRLCFAALTLSQAQSGSEALGKIWQLFVFVSVFVCSCVCSGACCCVCCSSIQRSLVTLGAASKTNCSARRVNHGSCFGYIGYTFIDIWEIIFFLCCRHTHTYIDFNLVMNQITHLVLKTALP